MSEFYGFWDRFGIPPGSLFGDLPVKMVTFLQAFWETPSGEAPGPVLEAKREEKWRFLRVPDMLET